jgi:hypothetical protein
MESGAATQLVVEGGTQLLVEGGAQLQLLTAGQEIYQILTPEGTFQARLMLPWYPFLSSINFPSP